MAAYGKEANPTANPTFKKDKAVTSTVSENLGENASSDGITTVDRQPIDEVDPKQERAFVRHYIVSSRYMC